MFASNLCYSLLLLLKLVIESELCVASFTEKIRAEKKPDRTREFHHPTPDTKASPPSIPKYRNPPETPAILRAQVLALQPSSPESAACHLPRALCSTASSTLQAPRPCPAPCSVDSEVARLYVPVQ